MKRVLSILVIASLFWFSICWPTIINIPADYPTIQQGIDASADGDTVLVQPGTYVENINFNGHNIALGSLFLTTGDSSYISQTIIDGDSAGTVVAIVSNEDSTTTLTGFTVMNGFGNAGGIQIANAAPGITHNVIKNNIGTIGGGGIEILNGGPTITNNIITDNFSEIKGAGIYCYGPLPKAKILNNLIINNYSLLQGGGITCFTANPLIVNNTFYGNHVDSVGGAIYCNYPSGPRIINCIFWGNSAPNGDAIFLQYSSPSTEIRYCDVQGGWPGIGNIDSDPLFRNPSGDDFHLMSQACGDQYDSPCIDIGNPSFIDRNLDCQNGLGTEASDLGTYGGGLLIPRIIHIPYEYSTIQDGIDASLIDGDTVLVQPGTYYENIDFNGRNIVLGSMFLTTGDTSYISTTAIDGDSAGPVVTINNNSFNNPTTVMGFSIQNGFAISGAGIHCYQSNPLISSNIIRNNMAINKGGGIRIDRSEPLVYNNVIENNPVLYVGKGGGIYCLESDAIIRKNRIAYNNIYGSGGGIFATSNSYVLIDSNTIESNNAGWGGGIDIYYSDIDIIDNTIRRNTCDRRGGGIKCSHSTVAILNNRILENISGGYGGGIYCDSLEIQIIGNTIAGNNAADGFGGGICTFDADLSIESNVIRNNISYNGGGGISSTMCTINIINNIIDNNTGSVGGGMINAHSTTLICGNIISNNAGYNGGGIRCHNNRWSFMDKIYNNIIFNNTADKGGGIYCGTSISMLVNNVLAGNIAYTQGGGLVDGGSEITMSNSIIWANSSPIDPGIAILDDTTISVSYCDIWGGWPGMGNIDIDPLFRDPLGADFHLMSTACGDSLDSPCIDAGDPNILDSLLDCSFGLGGPRSDMGGYGGGDSTATGIDFTNLDLPNDILILQNYPNPFNNNTNIEFIIIERTEIELAVYDLLGRRIVTLFKGEKGSGKHLIRWNGTDASENKVASGIYYCRISNGTKSHVKKMLLIK